MPSPETTLQQERYRIVDQLKTGEKIAVYQAYDNVLQTNVVLKEMTGDEAERLNEIKHDSIASAQNYFTEASKKYLVLETVGGGASILETIAKTQKPFSFLETLQLADQLLDALHYLHTQRPPIVHRAVAPQNIKLVKGKVKLLFAGDDSILSEIFVAQTANFSGFDLETLNLSYVPLELLWENLDFASRKVILNSYDDDAVANLEKPVDARGDVYALGATVYFMLTGQHPVDALSRSISILESDSDSLQAPHLLNHSIPAEVSSVVMRSMEIKRENRFSSAVIMRQILRTAFVKTNAHEKTAENRHENAYEKSLAANQFLSETKAGAPTNFEKERLQIEENRLKLEAEQKRLEEERLLIRKKRQEIEEARKQAELAEEKIKQAEQKRLAAEQRAAEAEKKLREKQKKIADDDLFELDILETSFAESAATSNLKNSSAETVPPKEIKPQPEKNSAKEFIPIAESETSSIAANKIAPTVAEKISHTADAETSRVAEEKFAHAANETADSARVAPPVLQSESASEKEFRAERELFADTAASPKSNSLKYVAAFVLVLILGGAGWAVWSVNSSKSSAQTEPVVNQTSAPTESSVSNSQAESTAPVQTPETATSPNLETVSETAPQTENPAISTETQPETGDQPAPRNRYVPAQSKKPIQQTAPKPVNSPKKAVTVDDIINDN